MIETLAKAYRMLSFAEVCGAIGLVANLVAFFGSAFLFVGANGDEWVRWYFGSNNGIFFVLVTVILGVLAFPFVKKMKAV